MRYNYCFEDDYYFGDEYEKAMFLRDLEARGIDIFREDLDELWYEECLSKRHGFHHNHTSDSRHQKPSVKTLKEVKKEDKNVSDSCNPSNIQTETMKNHTPDKFENNISSKSTALEKLQDMVGLKMVKEQMEELNDLLCFRKLTESRLSLPEMNMNCTFEGNPGTGKTVTAKIYADLLFETGFIKSNKLVCVSADGLIAQHIGGTAIKTAQVVQDTLRGEFYL